jgi:GNAT superfamily N-acetyltransferase
MSAEQEQRLVEFVVERLGPRADNWMELVTRFGAAHPRDEPHYYLTLLATHPSHRGRGIGMGLLAHNLAIIDGQHLPCYLESSNPANDDRYARLGFEAIGAIEDPAGGPSVATMWRTAR